MVNKSKYILYLRFFKVATLCPDDSFAQSWHSLNQLLLECFSNNLEGVPTYAQHLLAAFPSLCSPTHPNWFEVGRMTVRSSDAALHHSSSWSNSPYTAWRCGGSLSCLKTNYSPTKHNPDGMAFRWRMLW